MTIHQYSEGKGVADRTVTLECQAEDVEHPWVAERTKMYRKMGYAVTVKTRTLNTGGVWARRQGN